MTAVRHDIYNGTLSGTPPEAVEIESNPRLPMTFTLKSSNVARLVEFSTDGGSEYFTPAPDRTSSTMIVVLANSRVSHVRFTGAALDTWSIR
jgi:hypothetical protein